MKKYFIPLLTLILIAGAGCKKDGNDPNSPKPPTDLDDVRTVLLKDLVAERLPSPFYHFEYNKDKYVTQVDYASGLRIYNVEYENKRVKKMVDTRGSGNTIVYSYTNNQVSEMNEFFKSGQKKFSYRFSYNSNNQLIQVLWYEYSNKTNGVLYRRSVLSYGQDSNLASIDHYSNSTGQMILSKRDEFSNFDNKTNVNDFFLLQEFFDTFLFLPQMKFFKSNPLNQKIFTGSTDYDISYTYQFENNLPVRRVGAMTETRGATQGRTIEIVDRYSYY